MPQDERVGSKKYRANRAQRRRLGRLARATPCALGAVGLVLGGTASVVALQEPWLGGHLAAAGAASAAPPVVMNTAPAVALLATSSTSYSIVTADGGVFSFDGGPFFGSAVPFHPARPIVGAALAPSGGGYWLVGSDGGVFAFGNAGFYGSMGGTHLNAPIVGMAATPSGHGYWLVAADGGVFAFGDASFHGSLGGVHLNRPIVGMAVSPSGGGYWLAAGDGGVFAYGDAPFDGSMGGRALGAPVVGIGAAGDGYRLVGGDGSVFSFGAPFFGSMAGQRLSAYAWRITSTPSGNGYWVIGLDGAIYAFGDAQYEGRTSTTGAPVGPGALSTPPGYSPSQLVWQEGFSGTSLDPSKWNSYATSIAAGGNPWNSYVAGGVPFSAISPPGGYNAEVDSPALVTVDNGLSLNAVPGSPIPGYTYTGSVVDTYGKFAWSGGYFQALVKMPDTSDGYWPAIWFLPAAGAGTGSDASEFDLYEGGMRGPYPPNETLQANLHVAGASPQQADAGVDVSAGYHVYGAQYIPGQSLTVYFDGREVANYTQDVPTWPLQLVMDLAVGSASASAFHTFGTPGPASMQVAAIQFYS